MTVTKATKASTTTTGTTTTKASTSKPKASRSGKATTTTPADPAATEKARGFRVAAALKNGEGMTLAEVVSALGTAEVEAEGATESEKAIAQNLEAAKVASKAKTDALKATFPLMARLAAEINPSLNRPSSGPNKAKNEAIRALMAATGTSQKAATARLARYVAAGSLWLKHGVSIGHAYTMAGTMLSGESGAFWNLVEAPSAPALSGSEGKRGPAKKGAVKKGSDTTEKAPLPITAEAAVVVVNEAKASAYAKMTPAQRGAERVRRIVAEYSALMDEVKSGHATLTKAQATKVETVVATLAKAV